MKKITELLNIKYPIIQAGMVWVSGGKLAGAAAAAGCLGTIGAGSMTLELLKEHILKAQKIANGGTLAINIPLLYPKAGEQIQVALDLGIKVFITSAGSPKKFTTFLKDKDCIVIHVTSSPELAKKCEAAGVDAIIAEGFEAGGHNGRDEITTMVLIPQVVDAVSIPVIAAGGIGDGRTMCAAFALGAQAVQMGTRFMMTEESSAHDNYKNALIESSAKSTMLGMKSHVPVRLLDNQFSDEIKNLEKACASVDELKAHLGKGRAKLGMLDGDLDKGELEAGQVCGMINDLPTVKIMVETLIIDYKKSLQSAGSHGI